MIILTMVNKVFLGVWNPNPLEMTKQPLEVRCSITLARYQNLISSMFFASYIHVVGKYYFILKRDTTF